ncbi:MAG: hypothetical protein Q7T41_04400 [Candidatus Saccharibacteria bacterium]|nr:hypothetical protein [Candidatus Saccharibacteria bacterium]
MTVSDPRLHEGTHSLGEFTIVGESLIPPDDLSLLPEATTVVEEGTYTPLALRALGMAKKARERQLQEIEGKVEQPEELGGEEIGPEYLGYDVVTRSVSRYDQNIGRKIAGTDVVIGDRSVFVAHRNFTEAQIEDAIQRAEEELRSGGGHQLY